MPALSPQHARPAPASQAPASEAPASQLHEGLGASAPRPAAPVVPETAPNVVQVRILTIIVIVLGVLLLLGLATVVGRIIYLGSQRAPASVRSSSLPPSIPLALPAGASVKHTSLDGDRLAVTYEMSQQSGSGRQAGIIVMSLSTGQVVSRIELVTDVPR